MGNIKLLNKKKNAFYRSRISKIFPQRMFLMRTVLQATINAIRFS